MKEVTPKIEVIGKATHTARKSRQLIIDIEYCCPTITAGQGGGVTPKIIVWKNKK